MLFSGFFKSVITLLSGSVGAQLILVLSYFVLARLYGPEVIGAYRTYTAITLTGALLVNGGYELAIMMPDREARAVAILKLCSRIALVVFLLLLVAFLLFRTEIENLLQNDMLNPFLILIPFSLLLEGLNQAMHNFLVRLKSYRGLARILVFNALTFMIVALLPSLYAKWLSWLFIGLISSQVVRLLISVLLVRTKIVGMVQKEAVGMSEVAREYADYPRFHLGSGLSNYASRELVIPILGGYFGSAVAGWYAMAMQILQLPMRFILQAVPQVFYERIRRARDIGTDEMRKETKQALFFLFGVNFIPTLILALIGPWLFAILLGEEWRNAGKYLIWLLPFVLTAGLASPLTSVFNVNLKLRQFFLFNLGLLLTRIGALLIGQYFFDANLTIGLFGITAFLGAVILLYWILRQSGFFKRQHAN